MLPSLTDGKTILEPDLVEFHPLDEAPAEAEALTLESQLLFGPVRQRLRATKGALWWGSFVLADRVGLTVYAGQGAKLRLRILDLEYRVLEEQTCEQGRQRLSATVAQSGLVFFHLLNESERDELVFLQVARSHRGVFAPERASGLEHDGWLRRLGRYLRGVLGLGPRLETGAAR